ncbi:MAG: hypothetical protein LBE13_03635 [Bacteroidales bacterium]|jgi:hypothetical protein|nr:hypothetical protein [Bacteroidales bacterium]
MIGIRSITFHLPAKFSDTHISGIKEAIDLFDNPRNDKIRYETKNEEKR